jgi:hypothetical protein
MVDPLSLTALGAVVLTQGIGFLYGQVTELLRRRRDRREKGAAVPPVQIPPAVGAEQVLAGELTPGPVDEEALEKHADQLAKLKGLLSPYGEGDLRVDPANPQLAEQAGALRALLEQVYRQHITFQGEQRPAAGTQLQQVAGDVGAYANQVIASGERAVAIGGDNYGGINTGGGTATGQGELGRVARPPSEY